jgi:predicted Fe-Mo cluster-binding NifX family protein
MKVAIPICRNRISPVLDAAARLLVLTEQRGKEVDRREFTLEPQTPEALASCIAELSVDVLLCAALTEPLLRELEVRGIWVRSHLCGEVEEILQAFYRGRLAWNQYVMPGCFRDHASCP